MRTVIWEGDWLLYHLNGCELLICFDTFKDNVHAVSLSPWTEMWNTSVQTALAKVETTGTYSHPYNKSPKCYHCDNHPDFYIFTSLLHPHESGLASHALVEVASQGCAKIILTENVNFSGLTFGHLLRSMQAMLASVWVLPTPITNCC